jgi:hypothetical protein
MELAVDPVQIHTELETSDTAKGSSCSSWDGSRTNLLIQPRIPSHSGFGAYSCLYGMLSKELNQFPSQLSYPGLQHVKRGVGVEGVKWERYFGNQNLFARLKQRFLGGSLA